MPQDCTLREAINAVNAGAGGDSIEFAIGGGTPTIDVGKATSLPLPSITQPLQIDGSTGGALSVELSGANAGALADGLSIAADGCTVANLVINGFSGNGIVLSSKKNTVLHCFIGTDAAGSKAVANLGSGVIVDNGADNLIGGADEKQRNIISGNGGAGVLIAGAAASGNQVQGNYIGTDASATARLDNTGSGVLIFKKAFGNAVGAPTSAPGSPPGNVISGNVGNGVEISDAPSNLVMGNLIGIDGSGTTDLANGVDGVLISESASNNVGGTTDSERNVISSNKSRGIEIVGAGAIKNSVQGNFIGTDMKGSSALGNGDSGVLLFAGASDNIIGGLANQSGLPPGNVISSNGGNGVEVEAASFNQVMGNCIGTDASGGADLGNASDGVLLNDSPSNQVGGASAGEGNLISGNDLNGVELALSGATDAKVRGNFIGTDAAGKGPIGNSASGVHIDGGMGATIGGPNPSGNTIAYNGLDGVSVAAGTQHAVSGNAIFANGQLGIDLLGGIQDVNGVTANDATDFDGGPTCCRTIRP